MIYHSNLVAPDLAPQFRLRNPPMQMLGHDVPSDPDFWPDCGYLTHDEAAILYHWALALPGPWVDIGARLGWSTAHIAVSGNVVFAVEPELYLDTFFQRFSDNMRESSTRVGRCPCKSKDVLLPQGIVGALIDGDHDDPNPFNDAQLLFPRMAARCAILFHDYMGPSVWGAAKALVQQGFRYRVYWTPNMMCVCWRGDIEPVEHRPDPHVERQNRARLEPTGCLL